MKIRTIFSTTFIAVGMIILQTGCENRKKADEQYKADSLRDEITAYDTVFKSEEVSEPVFAKSEQHFDIAVRELDQKNYKKAQTEIAAGIAAIRLEGAQDKGELKKEFEKSLKHLESLQTLAAENKLTSQELKKGFWPAEMMVTHYAIQKWEDMPEFDVKSNDHLREALDGLERKTANIEASAKEEGQKLISQTRASLNSAEQNAGKDAKRAKEDLKVQTAELKAFIKKNI